MSHPSVVTIDSRSAPRTLFSGDQLVDVDLPTGTRVIYPKPPLAPLKDVNAAIRYAINHPYNSEPLYAKLRPGMKVTIAIDDISLLLPPMKRPDVRELVLTIVLDLLSDHGVDDVEMIIATSVHRRMTGPEVRHVVGDKIFNAYWPKKLYNHDGENAANMTYIGTTELGEEVELNKRAVDSDLVIYVNLNFVPMDGGHKSVAVGLCGYRSLRAHHNPKVMRACHSYMDPSSSALATSVERMGRIANQKLNVFTIETTINNRMFDRPLEFLAKNEDELTSVEKSSLRALRFTLSSCRSRRASRSSSASLALRRHRRLRGRDRGDARAHAQARLRAVPRAGGGPGRHPDHGHPFISPYNVNAFLNPLLVQVMANGYLFNLYKGVPMVKKGGTMIILHPCTDQFDNEHHAPYIEFVHRLCPRRATRWSCTSASRPSSPPTPRTSRCTARERLPPGSPVLHVVLGRGGPPAPRAHDRGRRRQRVHPQAHGLGDGAHDGRGPAHGEDHRAGAPGDPRAPLPPILMAEMSATSPRASLPPDSLRG